MGSDGLRPWQKDAGVFTETAVFFCFTVSPPIFGGEMIQFDYLTKIYFQIGLKPSTINEL